MSFSGKPTVLIDERIGNDGFWPDLSVAEFQKGYRLPAECLVDLLVADLTMAMIEVNTDLAKLKARWQGAGVSNVESADTTVLPERTFQAATYKRAVYSRAKASLLTSSLRSIAAKAPKTWVKSCLNDRKPSSLSARPPCGLCRAVAALRRRCCDQAQGVDRLSAVAPAGCTGTARQLDRPGSDGIDLEA